MEEWIISGLKKLASTVRGRLLLGFVALVIVGRLAFGLAYEWYSDSTPWLVGPSQLQVVEVDGITIRMMDIYTGGLFWYCLENHTGRDIQFHYFGTLEKEVDGVWHSLRSDLNGRERPTLTMSLSNGKDWGGDISLADFGPRLSDGHYRWVTYLLEKDGQKTYLAKEFDVT